jgi:demethylmenaquinone methyltransferase / 2-methoxy-6-polyprenyl-1,4-benzoquinol methylase
VNRAGTDTEMNPAAAPNAPLPGTRPEGARDESEAAREVRDMFSRIAPRYDFLNHLLSLSLDRIWRRRTARRFRHILRRPGARVLDLCCGTGDLTFALEREAGQGGAEILGSDFAPPMLALAEEKARQGNHRARFFAADALALPSPEKHFDLVTAAFGFRNLSSYERGLAEIIRVLRPGGEAGILEFTEPQGRLIAPLYRFYFESVLPRIGGAISGSRKAYAYLPQSVARFPRPDDLAAAMQRAGFRDAHFERWSLGIVALHSATL